MSDAPTLLGGYIMLQVSMKYFKDHVPGSVFDNQYKLAETLKNIGKLAILESAEINPLTVRLFNIKEALEKLEKCVSDMQNMTGHSFPDEFRNHYSDTPPLSYMEGYTAPSGTVAYTSTYLTYTNKWRDDPFQLGIANYQVKQNSSDQIAIIDTNNVVHTFDLYSGIYNFFVNLDSSLDRIRLELNAIYFDGYKEVNSKRSKGNKFWSQYLDPENDKIGLLETKGYSALVAILTGKTSSSVENRTSKYRNRLIHDGDLEIYIDEKTGKVFLPCDPLDTQLDCRIELLPYIQSIFSDLQDLMKQIYNRFILDIKAKNGSLPLI